MKGCIREREVAKWSYCIGKKEYMNSEVSALLTVIKMQVSSVASYSNENS